MSLQLSHFREIWPSFESGHLRSIPPEAENTDALSHTYCCGKAPLEKLVKIRLTSSVEDRESFSSQDDM